MRKNTRGFTLAELLIVVAIIAVLVAVSIPIFTGQLRKAREAVDLANMRAAKAVASIYLLEGNKLKNVTGAGAEYNLSGFYDISKSALRIRNLNDNTWNNVTTTISGYGKIIDDSIIAVRFNNDNNEFEYYWFSKADGQFYDEQWNLVNDPNRLYQDFWS